MQINIAKDFSNAPGVRYISQGPFSGEQFRNELLEPQFLTAKQKGEILEINMDNCFGFAPSFLDEAFRILAEKYGVYEVKKTISVIANDRPGLVQRVNERISAANGSQ